MIGSIPVGVVIVTLSAVVAVVPLRRPRPMATLSWLAGLFPNELPFVFGLVVIAPNALSVTDGESTDRDAVTLALTAVVVVALAILVRRALQARVVLERSLTDAGVADIRSKSAGTRSRRWLRIVLVPWPLRPRTVVRTANVRYADGGDAHLLDVYRHGSCPAGSPTLIHLHGGGFRSGRKSREARALLFRLAAQGWTCISANYHLSGTPIEGFPTHLVDVKRLLAWARREGREHGIDPESIVLSGTSAGAHLTAMAALTVDETRFQPGFEDADTSIAAGIGIGGYYGGLDGVDGSGTSPLAHHGTAPPFFVIHGAHDTRTPPEGARRLVRHLRAQPGAVVPHAELPGGQHTLDLFDSIRFEAIVDAIEGFTSWALVRAE